MKTKKAAEIIGQKVYKQLGKGWKPYIWENLGWHVHWCNGAICLNYTSREKTFWCMIGAPNSGTGHLDFGRNLKYSKNPKQAIRIACKIAREVIAQEWQPIIDSIEHVSKNVG